MTLLAAMLSSPESSKSHSVMEVVLMVLFLCWPWAVSAAAGGIGCVSIIVAAEVAGGGGDVLTIAGT